MNTFLNLRPCNVAGHFKPSHLCLSYLKNYEYKDNIKINIKINIKVMVNLIIIIYLYLLLSLPTSLIYAFLI